MKYLWCWSGRGFKPGEISQSTSVNDADLGWTDDTDAPRPRVFTAKATEATPSYKSLLSAHTAFTPRLSAR